MESGVVASAVPRVTLATATQFGAGKLASDIDTFLMKGEDNAPEGKIPMREEVGVRVPYAMIKLAFLALLGMVSVARRDDIG